MKKISKKGYSIVSPFWTLRDKEYLKEVPIILEKYSNDIYRLLLRKMTGFEAKPVASKEETDEIRHLFNEFVKVKEILAEDYKKDIL